MTDISRLGRPTPRYNDPLPATGDYLNDLCHSLGGTLQKTGVLKDQNRITTWIAKKRYLNRHDAIPRQPGAQLKIYKDKQ